jgi:hypothetical protein
LPCLTAAEEGSAGAEQDRREVNAKFFDQPQADRLAHHIPATHHDYILAVCGRSRPADRGMQAIGDEIEL